MNAGIWELAAAEDRIPGRLRAAPFLIVLTVLLLILNISALGIGAAPVGWADIWRWLHPTAVVDPASEQTMAVLGYIRLPRLVLANLAGAGLALSGAALQALFRNPLADPGLLGISSGAALGAGLMIVTGSAWLAGFAAWAVIWRYRWRRLSARSARPCWCRDWPAARPAGCRRPPCWRV